MTSAGRANTLRVSPAKCVHRGPRRQVHQVERPALVQRQRQVALDHHALGDRGPAADPELRGDDAFVHVAPARERRVLAVHRDRPVRDRRVLERAPHERRGDHGAPVVGEPDRALVGELAHLGQLRAFLPLGDRRQEADLHLGLLAGLLDERAEHGSRVDDRLGVGHGQDRAVPARRGGLRAGADRLLVLTARRAQVHVRVDERGREHEPGALDHLVRVLREVRAELRDHAVVDPHVDLRVDALDRVEHPRASHDQVLLRCGLGEQHHATPIGTSASTGLGPVVSRS